MQNLNTTIKKITAEETIPIRHRILRKGMPVSSCYFEGDNLPETFHLGLFLEDKLIGIATYLENRRKLSENELQLRGMAILEEYQGKGYGKLILEKGEEIASLNNKTGIWCNARTTAKRFYENSGYKTVSEPFDIPSAGEHYVMMKNLD